MMVRIAYYTAVTNTMHGFRQTEKAGKLYLFPFMRIRKMFIRHIRACKRRLFPDKFAGMKAKGRQKKYATPREELPCFLQIEQTGALS